MDDTEFFNCYRHPSWQKKRLEILERDNWTCQLCGNKHEELHVHHRVYIKNFYPWQYPNHLYITLCTHCHDESRDANSNILKHLHGSFSFSSVVELSRELEENAKLLYDNADTDEMVDCWPILPSDGIPYIQIFTEIIKDRTLAEFIRDMIEARARDIHKRVESCATTE